MSVLVEKALLPLVCENPEAPFIGPGDLPCKKIVRYGEADCYIRKIAYSEQIPEQTDIAVIPIDWDEKIAAQFRWNKPFLVAVESLEDISKKVKEFFVRKIERDVNKNPRGFDPKAVLSLIQVTGWTDIIQIREKFPSAVCAFLAGILKQRDLTNEQLNYLYSAGVIPKEKIWFHTETLKSSHFADHGWHQLFPDKWNWRYAKVFGLSYADLREIPESFVRWIVSKREGGNYEATKKMVEIIKEHRNFNSLANLKIYSI